MKKGRIKSYGAGQGVITPEDGSLDVFFLKSVIEGDGIPHAGNKVLYELYPGDEEPEAKKVIIVETDQRTAQRD